MEVLHENVGKKVTFFSGKWKILSVRYKLKCKIEEAEISYWGRKYGVLTEGSGVWGCEKEKLKQRCKKVEIF